jgi:hypothetical protein
VDYHPPAELPIHIHMVEANVDQRKLGLCIGLRRKRYWSKTKFGQLPVTMLVGCGFLATPFPASAVDLTFSTDMVMDHT